MNLTLKIKNELHVLDAMVDHPGIGFTQALKKSGMHRKTFYEALKRLQRQGVVEKYSWGKKKTYSVNILIAQIYLYKLGKLGLGNRYDEIFYFSRKITREQLMISKEIMRTVSFFGFNVFEKWRCPVIQHSSEKILYCLTRYGIWAYCNEIGCKYGVYRDFSKYPIQKAAKSTIQISLLRQRVDNSKGHTVMKPEVTTANHLQAVINSNEFQVFCSKKCPLSEEECKNYCPILTLHKALK